MSPDDFSSPPEREGEEISGHGNSRSPGGFRPREIDEAFLDDVFRRALVESVDEDRSTIFLIVILGVTVLVALGTLLGVALAVIAD